MKKAFDIDQESCAKLSITFAVFQQQCTYGFTKRCFIDIKKAFDTGSFLLDN